MADCRLKILDWNYISFITSFKLFAPDVLMRCSNVEIENISMKYIYIYFISLKMKRNIEEWMFMILFKQLSHFKYGL